MPTCLACLPAHVPTCLACLGAHVPTCLACTCSLANLPCVLTCWRANVPCLLMCSRANVLCVLTCSRANVACVLFAPVYLTCSRAITTNNKNKFSIKCFPYIFVIVMSFFFLRNKAVMRTCTALTRRKPLTGAMIDFVQ